MMSKVEQFQQRVAAKQVAAAGATLGQNVLDAAMTASRNAVDYLTGKLGDARLIQSERERIAGAIQSLEALRNSDPQGLFSVALKGAHDVVNGLFATPTTMEGRPGVGIVNDLRVAMTAVEHGVEAASSHLPIKRREIVTYASTVHAAGVFVSRSDGATLLLERGLPQSYQDELAKAKKAGRSTEYVFEDLFRFHHALGVESQPPKISECLFHVTTRRNLGAIASEGLRAKSYWAEAGDVVGYYEQVVRDEGDESVTLAVRIWDLHETGLAPDKPGIDEPITSAIGKSESEVHALWEASRGTWRNSLKIVGSARYDLPVPPAALYVVGRDRRLVPLAAFAAEFTHEHTPSAQARRPRM